MKKISKRNKLIVIICLVLAVALTALLLIIFPPRLAIPSVKGDELIVLGEPEYTILLEWEEVKGAIGYTVEYKYELYPKETHRKNVSRNSLQVERIKGKISYRVRAIAKWQKRDSDFTPWMTYEVPAIKLNKLAESINFIPNLDSEGKRYYRITEGRWEPVTYLYRDNLKTIRVYEMVEVPPGGDPELAFENPKILNDRELLGNFYFSQQGTWQIYIRAVNYKTFYQDEKIDFTDEQNDPVELYKLFEGGEWLAIELDVA